MATVFTIHPDTPQMRWIEKIMDALRDGAVLLYPTDTVYAIGCDLNVKSAVERVRQIKQLSSDKPLTFLCSSLSDIASYAYVTDSAYRTLKRLIPGPYTFLLPATKLVPRLVMSPKRKTTGIRVPDNAICQALLQALGNPIISTSAPTACHKADTQISKAELFDQLDGLVDVMIEDGEPVGYQVSTMLDLTGKEPIITRKGLGWEAAAAWAVEAS
ncbi:threonylcarbamoyl-AMP synthase [Oculatella sp. FACHB-28]|uniref:L-threonylcarbamoyladenylate synthase n=1 Tax=Cyanophyceae TaxID=3028117 RepID=UPI001685AD23|nr:MULTISPECIES: L-threonylcarbamoyladenylate synthase [Cyanophyceae]MBD1996609.1 threonylcarbamoyl-AMP synthase [Leptolyngbya sp. FACHB-541]MBD2057742.1 threonylcarbamoyl-AMP synthase [Oculatella sp. FACHB-28]